MSDSRYECPTWTAEALAFCGFTHLGEQGPAAVSNQTQVHGAQVHVITEPVDPIEGDGLWTAESGILVAVRAADCVPILLYDPGVPAVAAVHAGWRGTAAGIAGTAVAVGAAELGAVPARMRAALGPSIGVCCYEVGPEVVEGLEAGGLSAGEMGLRMGERGRPHVDLRRANRSLLEQAGLLPEHIEEVGGCSCCQPDRYESYRRDGSNSGRMRGIIGLGLLLIALLGPGCAPPEQAVLDVGGAMAEARQALEGGDAGAAELTLRSVLASRPDEELAHAELARALHLQGRDLEAVVHGRLAFGMEPALWEAAYNLACHYTALGEHDLAIRWLQDAVVLGTLELEEILEDPDLLALRDDHRFAFFESTGVLSRAEEDALVVPHRFVVAQGEELQVSVVVVALNRPLMSERLPVDLRLVSAWSEGLVVPLERKETLTTGESGGREYTQRTLEFTFVPLKAGLLSLGPFRVEQGATVLYTGAPLIEVRSADLVDGPAASPISVAEFFRAPSVVDEAVMTGLEENTEPSGSAVRRFRAVQAGALPEDLSERPAGAFRSSFLQRGTEGRSHVLDLRGGEDRDD